MRRRQRGAHAGRVDLLDARDAHRPGEPTRRERPAEARADAVARVGKHAAEGHARRHQAVELRERDLRLRAVRDALLGHPSALAPGRVVRPVRGLEEPQRHGHRHLAAGEREETSVREKSVWQFVVLSAATAYWRGTPTERVPSMSSAVPSMMSTAAGPPTSASAFAPSTRSSGAGSQQHAHTKWCTCA